ncbi:MAG: AAA family ATPase [Myxococcales bacterium]|nr:AAA family ATPase [Myxococcales bacterium]
MTSPVRSADEEPVLVGPYRLLGQLGGGGMGIVWRAEHCATGEVVALKTVRLPEPRMLASIRREIHALTRMRHPGVVRVVARGVTNGLPWYAMELLTGRTLAHLIRSTWSESQPGYIGRTDSRSRKLPTPVGLAGADTEFGMGGSATLSGVQYTLEFDAEPTPALAPAEDVGREATLLRPLAAAGEAPTLLRVALRLCETLAVLHGAGVVHRDLKPENVFVRATGEPVLVDFGLAAQGAAGREVLDAGGVVVGTLHYMAPEQLQGEYVDARADLYSLGCILYECLTGDPPFVGAPMQVIQQHLHRAPDPLPSRVDGISPALDALVQRLLCKDPRERAGYAADVAAELAALVGEPADIAPGGAPRQLYRAGFSGREGELDALARLLDHLAYGTGKLALVRGEAGTGKTRLLMEFARRAASGRPLIVTGECLAVGLQDADLRVEAAPLHPFRELFLHVVDRAHKLGPDETQRLLGADLRVLAEFEPALLGLPGAAAAPEVPVLPGEARRQRVVDAMTRLLTALARPGPLVLLLDDVQWADELTLAVLAALPSTLPKAPALVVCAYRPDEAPRELHALASRPGVHGIALRPLRDAAARSIVADVLALPEPPDGLLADLEPEDAGNPFFITELLHVAHDEGLLVRDGHDHWRLADRAAERLPHSMRDISARRLAALAPATRRVVDVAAVLGRILDLDLLIGVEGLQEDEVLDAVDDLILHRVVQRSWTGDLTFVHDGVLATAYAALAPDRREALHGRIAERIEAARPQGRALPELAHHWSRAGAPARAFHVLVRNARRTLAAGAHHQAKALLQRVWALVDAGLVLARGERSAAALLTAEAALGLGDIDAAQARVAEALQLQGHSLPRSEPGWFGELVLAMGRQFTGLARRAGRRARADPRPSPAVLRHSSNVVRAQALNLLQQSYVARGDTLRLLATCFMAANTAEGSPDAANPAIAYSVIGAVCGAVGLESRAAWYFAEASAHSRRLGDAHSEVAAGVAECAHWLGVARWDLLESRGGALAATARAIGARHEWEGLTLMTAGGRLRHRGCAGVREPLSEALASAVARNNELSAAWCRVLRSECDLWLGSLDQAEIDAGLAIPAVLRGSGKGSAAVPRAVQAAVFLEKGQLAEAAAAARQVLVDLKGETLLFMHETACRLAADVLLDLWDDARTNGRSDADEHRHAAHTLIKLERGLARRTPFARPTAMRLTGKAMRIAGQQGEAREHLAAALAHAAEFALERGLIELELGLCLPVGAAGRDEHARRACAHFDACDAATGVHRVERALKGPQG